MIGIRQSPNRKFAVEPNSQEHQPVLLFTRNHTHLSVGVQTFMDFLGGQLVLG